MKNLPDLGLKLLDDGVDRSIIINLIDFQMINLSILELDKYSTMNEKLEDGVVHAVSLDFGQEIMKDILDICDQEMKTILRREISRVDGFPRYISFECIGAIRFNARANLGNVEETDSERFIPLVIQKVSSI